jgi:hypothetical protein
MSIAQSHLLSFGLYCEPLAFCRSRRRRRRWSGNLPTNEGSRSKSPSIPACLAAADRAAWQFSGLKVDGFFMTLDVKEGFKGFKSRQLKDNLADAAA